MKTRKALILATIFTLLTSIFPMSGDDKNEPQVEKNQIKQEIGVPDQAISEPVVETNVAKSGQTVKDEFGIDTGMTKEELDKFKENYYSQFSDGYRGAAKDWFYRYKIDRSKFYELKKVGVNLSNAGTHAETKTYKENTVYSHIIIIGTTIDQKKNGHEFINTLEIDSVLKGKDILINKLGKIPKEIEYPSQPNVVGETQPVLGERAIYFLAYPQPKSRMGKKYWIIRRPESTLICLDNDVVISEVLYGADSNKLEKYKKLAEDKKTNKYILEPYDEVISNIVEILKIHDQENFYKMKFNDEVIK